MQDRHGGNLRRIAEQAGKSPEDILDFSANINPLGPPAWLRQVISRSLGHITRYPDPECRGLIQAACERFGVSPEEVLCGNGSTELLFALAASLPSRQAIIPVPAYVDYAQAARAAGLEVEGFALRESDGFALDPNVLAETLAPDSVVFLGQPNNPTGRLIDPDTIRKLATRHPHCEFVVDEAFADFVPGYSSLIRNRPDNLLVLFSLTKLFAIPGLRLGLGFARPELATKIRSRLYPWSVNSLAQSVGERALRDENHPAQSQQSITQLREELVFGLESIQELKVYPSVANFLLVRMLRPTWTAARLAKQLLGQGLAIRVCDNFEGLSDQYFRIAVRTQEENQRLLSLLQGCLSGDRVIAPKAHRAATLMFQGTGSHAGKSILTAALCRILLQDGVRVAPFKAQNMSLNSFVTREGGEMGRAQVLQAQACRLEPDVRMNPILLKPNTDTGSQVILMGQPVDNMNVGEYFRYKAKALGQVQQAFDSLAEEFEAVLLEGAGSPGEVNLKHHDIVNMQMARHAKAPVLLVGDIDRGGVFASLIGHMEVMEEWERNLVAGFVINRFRGDATQLKPAIDYLSAYTDKPTWGIIPYLSNLDLPEEDSVSFKQTLEQSRASRKDAVNIAVVSLPHISNFTDTDPFRLEPDVNLRNVTTTSELGRPDAIILPGSKNVISDMAWLMHTGLTQTIQELAREGSTQLVGICGGFQMLGDSIQDPHRLESSSSKIAGLGLLSIQTVLARPKILRRAQGVHLDSRLEVSGYEIHHGQTNQGNLLPVLQSHQGEPLGLGTQNHRIWGTYLHGVFDADAFRRWFLDDLRQQKGYEPLKSIQAVYDLEPHLDRLAEAVRECLPMDRIRRLMGL